MPRTKTFRPRKTLPSMTGTEYEPDTVPEHKVYPPIKPTVDLASMQEEVQEMNDEVDDALTDVDLYVEVMTRSGYPPDSENAHLMRAIRHLSDRIACLAAELEYMKTRLERRGM